MLNKQRSKYTKLMPVFVSCHFFGNESQVEKVMLVGCDWWISILVCLACRKTMLSGDVFRTIAAMHVTLKVGVSNLIPYYWKLTMHVILCTLIYVIVN